MEGGIEEPNEKQIDIGRNFTRRIKYPARLASNRPEFIPPT